MQKEQVWAQYVKKNPGFETDGAKFTAAGLKKFFDVTWEAAHSLGVTNGKAIANHEHENKTAGLGAFAQALGLYVEPHGGRGHPPERPHEKGTTIWRVYPASGCWKS